MASSLYLSNEGSFMEFRLGDDFVPIGTQCARFVELLSRRNKDGVGREDLVRKAIVGNTLLDLSESGIKVVDNPEVYDNGDLKGGLTEREVPTTIRKINSEVYRELDTFDRSSVPSILNVVGGEQLTKGVRNILQSTRYKLHLIGPPTSGIVTPGFFIDEDFFVMNFMGLRQFSPGYCVRESSN
jgi:hypothetical protein